MAYAQHPLLGVGLNNSTAAMKPSRQELRDAGVQVAATEPADSYYLAVLMEVGPVGTFLFLAFFVQIMVIGARAIKEASADAKPLVAATPQRSLMDNGMRFGWKRSGAASLKICRESCRYRLASSQNP
jgi:O-antigen ligase